MAISTKLTPEQIKEQIAMAIRQVAAMPAWKRNILLDSSKPMWPTPRPYVNNFPERSDY